MALTACPRRWRARRVRVSLAQADVVRQQIDAGREFRGRVDAFWEACEQWADTQLAEVSTSSEEDKKNSNRISKPKSPRKSKPS